jgi:hypothetical protein
MSEKKKKKEKSLWWSSFSTYEACPQKFLFKYGQPGIDLGAGDGKPKPLPEQRTEHHLLMGIVVQYGIEKLYNDGLFLRLISKGEDHLTTPEMVQILKDTVKGKFEEELRDRYIHWGISPPENELLKTCMDSVLGYLRTLKAHRLFGEFSQAESFMFGYVEDVPVAARVDMLIRRDEKPGRFSNLGWTILDGKNSKHKGKYTDADQLRFYALVFYLSYGFLPDRVGFVYYRFPHGKPQEGSDEIESGVEWVPLLEEDVRGIAQRVVNVRRGIREGEWEARPTPPMCRFCDWEKVCPERQAQIDKNRRKRGGSGKGKKKKKKPDPVPSGVKGDDGFEIIGG